MGLGIWRKKSNKAVLVLDWEYSPCLLVACGRGVRRGPWQWQLAASLLLTPALSL